MADSKPVIRVEIEGEPKAEIIYDEWKLSGGSFTIDQRLPRGVWDKMKAAGAWYISREEIEDMDWFHLEPGWRYKMEAIMALIEDGYTVHMRGENFDHPGMFWEALTPEANERWRRKQEREKQEREEKRKERAQLEARKRQAISDKLAELRGDGWTAVERFDTSDLPLTVEHDRSSHVLTMYDRISEGEINGVPCAYFNHYTGGHDFLDIHEYYCQDPAAAGLTPIGKTAERSTLDDFFE